MVTWAEAVVAFLRLNPQRVTTDLGLELEDLKQKTVRGGAARLVGHAARSVIRLAALMTLARLLGPAEFGLVAMVTAVTGILEVFATGGLSIATIQRDKISHAQVSTLFWCNLAIGALLSAICLGAAPFVGTFYHDPRTALVLAVIAPVFLFNASGVQHIALLQRDLRYVTLAGIEVTSEVVAAVVAIAMALSGWGYWSVVAAVMIGPMVIAVGGWITSGWRPGLPRKEAGIGSMLHFGGTLSIYGLIVYIAYNTEKVLIGRNYGSDALGLYGKAYELINMPIKILGTAVGIVAISSLARVQNDTRRLKSYLLKGTSLFLAMTLPAILGCVVFADDIILVMLGSNWSGAVPIFQLLAPSVIVLSVLQPLSWLLMALGLHQKNLKISFVLAPLVICSYFVGLPYGPTGVALAFSTTMVLWMVPQIVWTLRGTPISLGEFFAAASRPAIAAVIAAGAALALQPLIAPLSPALLRLALGGSAMLAVYAFVLFIVMKQNHFYFDLVRTLWSNFSGSRRAAEGLAQ